MSMWTYVTGNARVYAKHNESILTREIRVVNALGYITSFTDQHKPHPILPYGSEGSLRYIIDREDDMFNLTIFGDLRDYNDLDEIEQWFRQALSNLRVLQAALTVQVGDYMSEIMQLIFNPRTKTVERFDLQLLTGEIPNDQ